MGHRLLILEGLSGLNPLSCACRRCVELPCNQDTLHIISSLYLLLVHLLTLYSLETGFTCRGCSVFFTETYHSITLRLWPSLRNCGKSNVTGKTLLRCHRALISLATCCFLWHQAALPSADDKRQAIAEIGDYPPDEVGMAFLALKVISLALMRHPSLES